MHTITPTSCMCSMACPCSPHLQNAQRWHGMEARPPAFAQGSADQGRARLHITMDVGYV